MLCFLSCRRAADAGFYTSPDGSRYPRLQLLTIKDLLEGNKNVQRPSTSATSPSKKPLAPAPPQPRVSRST